MIKRYRLMDYARGAKVILHKGGCFLFRPAWNHLSHVPLYDCLNLAIILTKICNANCIFCAYQFIPQRERMHMSDEVFSKIIEEIRALKIHSVHLTSSGGEPLLAPNFLEKVKALRRSGVGNIQITTNAITLDQIGIEEFLNDGPDIINISTTALDQKMYQRIFRSEEFQRMRNNLIKLLLENKRRGKLRRITLGIRPDIPKKEVIAMPQMSELFDLADEVSINQEYADWLGLIKSSMLSGSMKIEKPRPISKRPCQILTTTPAIHPNGDITACVCRNIHNDPDMYLGNILKDGLKKPLKEIEQIAKKWRQGKFPKTCHLCSMYTDPAYYWPDYLRKKFLQIFRLCRKKNIN